MRQIPCTLKPLPKDGLHVMRKSFPQKDDHFDLAVILDSMGHC